MVGQRITAVQPHPNSEVSQHDAVKFRIRSNLQTAKPPVQSTEGLQSLFAMILTTPTVVAVTPPVMAVCIRSRVFPANPRMLTINNWRVNITGAIRHVRCGSDVTVGVRTSNNVSIRRTGTHAHSNNNLSICLRRSDERHRKDQSEQRKYRFLQHFPDLHCTLV